MCGIAGQIEYQRALWRRGPDQDGLYLSPHAVLAHTRLCVIGPGTEHSL